MNEQQWRAERDDRTLRYAHRRLDPDRWIIITVEPEYLQQYEGQVALLTAATLLGRMSPSVALNCPTVHVHARLPWRNRPLPDVVLPGMHAADPFGRFCQRAARPADYRLHLGRSGHDVVVHGVGWNAFLGNGPSPLPEDSNENPIGAALAAVLAVSQIFAHEFRPPQTATTLNGLTWDNRVVVKPLPGLPPHIGTILIAGVGSVGTAALYFLGLTGRGFEPALIDADVVKVHNLDRSPLFTNEDVGISKVRAARRFLEEIGIEDAPADERPLHESALWLERRIGWPDILVAAANEMDVRYHIESRYPPVQLYGTTGRNWQCSAIRHIPFADACSCCLFPPDIHQPATACATAPSNPVSQSERNVDAALPFLSFAAGLMTVAEVLKLEMPGYPFSTNRVTLYTRPSPRLAGAPIPRRLGCVCEQRSENVHRRMLDGSKYGFLSV